MKRRNLPSLLWGDQAHLWLLLLASTCLLFLNLGGKEIWTQEHRWADIVSGMFYRHDFFHPYLGNNDYYDKPLLSYWFIVFFTLLFGKLTAITLRLPSALSALLAIYALYKLGTKIKDQRLGFLSAWMMLTTYYFLFWARISSADMLNLSGSLCAVAWYYYHRDRVDLLAYLGFFLILAVTSLCKGLVGAIIPLLAVSLDMLLRGTFLRHFNWRVFAALILPMSIYLLPFMLSACFKQGYDQNGLYLVYRENILRYFQPFDHKGPIYTYLIYLPIYLFPWSIFLIPALWTLLPRYRTMTTNSKWCIWVVVVIFLFFTLSGSRRSYYILPILPFTILFIADWFVSASQWQQLESKLASLLIFTFAVSLFAINIIPTWYFNQFGAEHFVELLKADATQIKPWGKWHFVLLDAESKVVFYLHLPPVVSLDELHGARETQTSTTLLKAWPILLNKPEDTIFITRERYKPSLQAYFANFHVIELPTFYLFKTHPNEGDKPIAFVPNH